MKTKSLVLILSGIVIGCGAGATVAVSWAGPTSGQWQCYAMGPLPDIAAAATKHKAEEYSSSLNQIAPSSPVGAVTTLITVPNDDHSYICAKN